LDPKSDASAPNQSETEKSGNWKAGSDAENSSEVEKARETVSNRQFEMDEGHDPIVDKQIMTVQERSAEKHNRRDEKQLKNQSSFVRPSSKLTSNSQYDVNWLVQTKHEIEYLQNNPKRAGSDSAISCEDRIPSRN